MIFLKKIVPYPVKELLKNSWSNLLFSIKIQFNAPVMIYQMGKVGSSSIYQSLSKQYNGPVLHNHVFSSTKKGLIKRFWNYNIKTKKPLYVISVVREPIGRNVSCFFQNLKKYTGYSPKELNISTESLIEIFLSDLPHELPLKWFDDNIKKNFDIDVFETPFPSEGFCTYHHDNVHLLVLKLEINDEVKIAAIKNFLGLKNFELFNANIGNEKDYASTYKEFKKQLILPDHYIDKMSESKFFTHFYTTKEIEKVKNKWYKKL
jgi:hypothetical protein